ncbi:MAG: hypothetical protein NWE78_02610 [Candidatus Bathyarchaeota archaeon]|nr:hypothetical protein [Candidatus Bathyarchaeota archaeon]
MTSHGFILGRIQSNFTLIAGQIADQARRLQVKRMKVHFLNNSARVIEEDMINIILEFDCHEPDGKPNLQRVDEFRKAVNGIKGVNWITPALFTIETHAYMTD